MDLDWAEETGTRRSHAAYVLMLNGGPVSRKSRRQDSVALSTSEAEYIYGRERGRLGNSIFPCSITTYWLYAGSATNVYETI